MVAVSIALAGTALPQPHLFAQQADTDALVERVRLWMSRERLDLAREAADRLMLVAPGHPAALAALAEIELRNGNLDAASSTLARLRSSSPDHPEVARIETLVRLGGPDRDKLREARLLARTGRSGKALKRYRELLPNGPPSGPIALEYWNLVASSSDGWDAAHEGLARLAREHPENDRYRLALAEHEISRKPIQPRSLRTLIELSPVPAFSRQAKAAWRRAVLRLDATTDTIRSLREYLATDPDDSAVRERLDVVLAELERIRRREADPAYQDGRRGLAALERGDLVSAEHHLTRSIARSEDPNVVGGMGLLRLRQGRHAEARTYFDQAASLSNGESKWRDLARTALFWGLLGESREAFRTGAMQDAEHAAREALRVAPRHADALIALGEAQAGQGQASEAEATLQSALGVDPASVGAIRALVALYVRQQDRPAFERLVDGLSESTRTALAAEIASLRARLLAGEAERLVAAERIPEAMRVLQRAVEADPDDPWPRYDLARLHLRRGEPEEARALLEALVARRPQHADSLHAFAQLLSLMNEDKEALAIAERIPPEARSEATNGLARRLAARIRFAVLQAEATALTERSRIDDAVALLGHAMTEDDRRPWLGYDLARLYVRQGEIAKGRALLESQVVRDPADADALHALALFLSQLDEDLPALQTLEQISSAQRSEGMIRLQRRVWLRAQMARAKAYRQAGARDAGADLLARAQAAVADDPELALSVASAWIEAGAPERARALVGAIAAHGEPTPGWRLRHARLLLNGGFINDLPPLLESIARAPDLDAEQRNTLDDLREAYAVSRSSEYLRLGMTEKALAALRGHGDETPPRGPRLMLAEARVLQAMNRPFDAIERYQRVLVLRPGDDETRVALADALVDAGDDDAARVELASALARSPQHPGALELLARIEQRAGRVPAAVEHLQRSLKSSWEVRAAAGAMGELSTLHATSGSGTDGASAASTVAVQMAPAFSIADEAGRWAPYRRLAEMLDLSTPWVSLGVDARFRSGTEGLSSFHAWEAPVEWKGAWRGGGRPFVRADLVRLDAGTLDLGSSPQASEFGSVLLCQPACPAEAFRQSETGASLLVGLETERLRVDVGSTPLGFPVQHVVGGVRYEGDLGRFSYAVDASSRPLTSSLLSYAGARDPRTGAIWGGVRATGVRINLSRDDGGAYGAWSLVDLHRLTGKNVQANNRFRLMAGGYWRIINTENRVLSLGLTGMRWRFSENAGEFTYGHGGYFSPQHYRSVSFPLVFGERTARFSYMLRAAVSTSRSETDSAPFYPTDAALQADAQARVGITDIDPQYSSSVGAGRGYSVAAAFEYQVRPNVFIGGRAEIERSRNFEPNRVTAYLRIALDQAAAAPVPLIPTALVPSSEL